MTRIELPGKDMAGLRAANPGPFTLGGTNTWIVGREPAWVIDPGPALDDHLDAVASEVAARGGLAGIALTHDHADHTEAVSVLHDRFPDATVAAGRGAVDRHLSDGEGFGPLTVVGTPGHAPDHLSFVVDGVAFTGDAVLGEGSVFIYPDPGALRGYLAGLSRLQEFGLELIAPGHGPLVDHPQAKLEQYIAHRLERERRLIAALDDGLQTVDELLDRVWDDAPAALRPAAAVTLAAHLDKLEEEDRLPAGIERPTGWR